MTSKIESIDTRLKSLPFFKRLSGDDTDFLFSAASIKDYPKNKMILLQGDKADRYFIILKGWVKLYNITADGRENLFALLTIGDTFGVISLLSNFPYTFSAETIEGARIMEIPSDILKTRMKSSHDITHAIMRSLAYKLQNMQLEKSCVSMMLAPQRIACFLLRLSSWIKGKGGTFPLPYDKSVAALHLGMDGATFSRALTKLEMFGVSSENSEVRISNFASLAESCCARCPIPEDLCLCRNRLLQSEKITAANESGRSYFKQPLREKHHSHYDDKKILNVS